MKTILIPTDFSSGADNAARFAFQLMRDEACHFILLHCYHVPATTPDISISISEVLKTEAEKKLEEEWEKLQYGLDLPPGSTVERVSEYGSAVMVIEQLTESREIDLVVMGTTGASGFKEALIGSNTSAAMNHVKCPLLAVPEQAKFESFDKVVFATDFKELNSEAGLDFFKAIAKKHQSAVTILHVQPREKLLSLESSLEGMMLHNYLEEVEHVYDFKEGDDPVGTIHQYVSEQKAGLLAVIAHDYGLFKALFHKSITKKLVHHTKVPMLVLHDYKEE